MDNGTPRNTREAIVNALAELKRTSPHGTNGEMLAKAVEVIYRHIYERHSQDATTSELSGETPKDLFHRMYPTKPSDDTEPGGGLME